MEAQTLVFRQREGRVAEEIAGGKARRGDRGGGEVRSTYVQRPTLHNLDVCLCLERVSKEDEGAAVRSQSLSLR